MSVVGACLIDEREVRSLGAGILLRSYRAPGSASSGLGAGLLFFHAGGFVAGDVRSHGEFCQRVCLESGAVVVACGYRLAPAHRFPRALEDGYLVSCFVHEHADEFGIDHRRLGIAGVEAGGGLATGIARLAKERRNPALAAQVLIAPWLDLREPGLGFAAEAYAPNAADREDARCSPVVAQNLIGLPPAWIAALGSPGAPNDAADQYAARLRDAYVGVSLIRLDTSDLKFVDDPGSEAGQAAIGVCCDAVDRALSGA